MMAITHPSMGDVRMSAVLTSDDPDQQVADTIALMRQYAIADARTASIKKDIWRSGIDSVRDQRSVCDAVWRYVKSKIRFTQDADLAEPIRAAGVNKHPIVEILVRPVDISNGAHQGDCDDYSMYLACLLVACGIPCAFATVAADYTQPRQFSHVYVVAYPNGQRYPLDASHGQMPGWEKRDGITRIQEWPVNITAQGGWE